MSAVIAEVCGVTRFLAPLSAFRATMASDSCHDRGEVLSTFNSRPFQASEELD